MLNAIFLCTCLSCRETIQMSILACCWLQTDSSRWSRSGLVQPLTRAPILWWEQNEEDVSKKMSGSFAQKDNVLFEQQSLGQSIRAVVPELPAEVWVSALTLHRALRISPSLAIEVTLSCRYICFQKGGPGVFRSVAVLLVALGPPGWIIDYGSHILGRWQSQG